MNSKNVKEKFVEVQELYKSGDLHGAINILNELISIEPNSAKLRGTLANTYWELKNYEEANKQFKKSIELAPEWEDVSLGLFHCLWEQDRKEEAFAEMKRFMTISTSEEYKKILKDINEEKPM